jgi:hypothetical protein
MILEDGFYASTITVFDENGFEVGRVTVQDTEKTDEQTLRRFKSAIITVNEKNKARDNPCL